MFRGFQTLNLDSKGRLAMPSKYRERLSAEESGEMIVTMSIKKCLEIYPLSEWEEVEAKLMALPTFDKNSRLVRELYFNSQHEVKLDAGGRILLPQVLRDRIGLDKSVVLSGQGKKFELWDEPVWSARFGEVVAQVENIDWENVSPELAALSL